MSHAAKRWSCRWAAGAFGRTLFRTDGRVWGTDKFNAIQTHKGVLSVAFFRAPVFVTFNDINDPKTIQLVDPENLSASFGNGFALKSIQLEIVEPSGWWPFNQIRDFPGPQFLVGAPITKGEVARVLAWWSTHEGRLKPPELRLGPGLHPLHLIRPEELISSYEFVRGLQK
jgi:hypothetical protein